MTKQIQMVIYEGWLAANPEMRFTPKGVPVTNFRMGSNSDYKDADGNVVKETTWLKVSCWNKTAEIVNQYTEKGSRVVVIGKLRSNEKGSPSTYKLDDGTWAASWEINAKEVHILKGKENATPPADAEEDLPF